MNHNVELAKAPGKRKWHASRRAFPLKSLRNLSKMGHCAPTVMCTLQELRSVQDERMVRLASGMAGGIGNSGSECGAVTSPIMTLGLEYGPDGENGQIPKMISIGQSYLSRFSDAHGGVHCREISQSGQGMLPCIKAICEAPGLLRDLIDEDPRGLLDDIDDETARACAQLLQTFHASNFHCAHSVLRALDDGTGVVYADEKLLRASFGFLGGTLFQGLTCGALTAGVLAIGLILGEIEDSRARVLKWILQMVRGDDELRDEANKFHRAINAGNQLVLWFEKEFSSTQCRDILQVDLATLAGVERYAAEHKIDRCCEITYRVAQRVQTVRARQ